MTNSVQTPALDGLAATFRALAESARSGIPFGATEPTGPPRPDATDAFVHAAACVDHEAERVRAAAEHAEQNRATTWALLDRAARLLRTVAEQSPTELAGQAGQLAQAIEDEIGTPTDAPIGPLLRDQLAAAVKDWKAATAEIARLRAPLRSAAETLEAVKEADPLFSDMLAAIYDALGDQPPHGPVPEDVDDEGHRLSKATGLEELLPYADDPAGQPGPGLLADVAKIAGQFRGLAYDPQDRPTEVLAVRRAALAAGLVPVPDPSLVRTYRGCTPPVPSGPAIIRQTARSGLLAAAAAAGDVALDFGTSPAEAGLARRVIELAPGETVVICSAEAADQ